MGPKQIELPRPRIVKDPERPKVDRHMVQAMDRIKKRMAAL
jgi:hypothetical protein